VRGRKRHVRQRPAAQRGVPVARSRGRRCRRRAPGPEERRDRAHDQHARDHGGDDRAAAARRRAVPRRALPPLRPWLVDEPEHRADARVDQVQADHGEHELQHRIAVEQAEEPERDEQGGAEDSQRRVGRLGGEPCGHPAQRRVEIDGTDERGGRRGHDRAASGEDPGRRAQVAEEGVPDRAHRRARIGAVRAVDHEGAPDGERDDDDHAADRRAGAELHDGPPAVGRQHDRARRGGQREQGEEHGEQPHGLGRSHRGRAGVADVAVHDLDLRRRLELGGQ
jgi:hypothetical protein